jgi:hypothetical protein
MEGDAARTDVMAVAAVVDPSVVKAAEGHRVGQVGQPAMPPWV